MSTCLFFVKKNVVSEKHQVISLDIMMSVGFTQFLLSSVPRLDPLTCISLFYCLFTSY